MGLGRKIPEVRAIPVPYFQQGLSLLMWPPPPACWWSLSTGKFLPALSTLSSLEGSSLCTAHRWGWGLCALSWRTEYQHQLLGTLRRFVTSSPLTHSLVHSRQCWTPGCSRAFQGEAGRNLVVVCVRAKATEDRGRRCGHGRVTGLPHHCEVFPPTRPMAHNTKLLASTTL